MIYPRSSVVYLNVYMTLLVHILNKRLSTYDTNIIYNKNYDEPWTTRQTYFTIICYAYSFSSMFRFVATVFFFIFQIIRDELLEGSR
jgi:hypothetical protein